jgi:hypothetical protein
MFPHQPVELGKPALGDDPDRARKLEHGRVGEPVVDEQAILAAFDQARFAQGNEVLRCVGEREPGLLGQRIDGAFALRQKLQELQPMGARKTLSDARELAVEPVLEGAMGGVMIY